MATREDARALANRLHALVGGAELVRKAAARELASLDPTDATEVLQHLLMLSRGGWETATCVLASIVAALEQEADQIPFAEQLRRLARLQDLESVAALFPTGPPAREMDPGAAAKNDATAFTDSLGHLKTEARTTRDPDRLAYLATASNASVIHNVLLNPRTTEALVVRIAARRPSRPEPLTEIWHSDRWSRRHAVRRALALNPYLPPEVGAKIVPLLNLVDLGELERTPTVHASLRDQARLLLASTRAPGDSEPPIDPREPN